MKTDMHENSIAAYKELNLGAAQYRVLSIFLQFPTHKLTDRFVAEHAGLDINRVTGRIRELTDLEVLEECGKKKGNFGKMVRLSRIRSEKPLL